MSNSKKPGKDIEYFVNHWLTSKAVWFGKNNVRFYPGALISVDIESVTDWITIQEPPKPLPPGIPLDDDILNGILQHLSWWDNHEITYAYVTGLESMNIANKIDILYMEALWRKLKKKTQT